MNTSIDNNIIYVYDDGKQSFECAEWFTLK